MALLRLSPVLKDYIWGGKKLKEMHERGSSLDIVAESWELSVHKDGESIIENGGYRGKTLRQYLYDNPACGCAPGQLPVLIKYIDAAHNLSVQVHPGDEYAKERENDNGKTEMWYVISAEKGAGIYRGFKRDVTAAEVRHHITEGSIEQLLSFTEVQPGDSFLIRAGTVHAVCAGVTLLEVQQSSNVTYRVYDYGRKDKYDKFRDLHIDKALDTMDLSAFDHAAKREPFAQGIAADTAVIKGDCRSRLLAECQYFRCTEYILNGSIEFFARECCLAVNIIDGSGNIADTTFKKGDCFFCTAGDVFKICGCAQAVVTEF